MSLQDMKSSKTEKIDKRAAALRDNLKRRKQKAQSDKNEKQKSQNDTDQKDA